MNQNHQKTILDFIRHVEELTLGNPGPTRTGEIRADLIATENLVQYSAEVCRDFAILNQLLGIVARLLDRIDAAQAHPYNDPYWNEEPE